MGGRDDVVKSMVIRHLHIVLRDGPARRTRVAGASALDAKTTMTVGEARPQQLSTSG